MIKKVVVVIGLNEEGEGLEFGHEVAHEVCLISCKLRWDCRRNARRLVLILTLHNCWTHAAQLAFCVRSLHTCLQTTMQTTEFCSRQKFQTAHLRNELLGKLVRIVRLNTREATSGRARFKDGEMRPNSRPLSRQVVYVESGRRYI